jgi:transposase InsO family protein
MKTKKSVRKQWAVSEKLEIVQARQSGLTLDEVKSLYGVSATAVSEWLEKYEKGGIAGLETQPTGGAAHVQSQRVAAAEQLVDGIKSADPDAGVGKVQGELSRHGFLSLARETVRNLLRRKGHGPILGRSRRKNRPAKVRHFERALPNELWQTDIMSFMIKGQYRVYVIGFLDDHSRFIVGWGLYRFQTAANVQEVFRAGIEKHGLPKEVLSDNGRQYYSWRGRSQFTEMLTKLGIRHIRSRPYHPQTCGKIESFWRNVIQECLAKTPLGSFDEAKEKIGEYVEYYNFKRPHQGIENVTPSDRFYRVADQVRQIVASNTEKVEAAPTPAPEYRAPMYIVGNIDGKELRVVAKDAEVSLKDAVPGNVKSETGGLDNERSAQRQEIAEPAGAAGVDPAGAGPSGAGDGAVPAGGSVPGAVLPVDASGAGGGAEGAGGEGAGAQADRAGEGAKGGAAAAGAGGAAGEGAEGGAPGGRALETSGGDSKADHPSAGMGSGSGVAV